MAVELTGGWVKLWRSIGDSDLWLMEPFTKAQAWIDLILHANHKPGYINIRGAMIRVERGQIGWSELTMSKRWRWSREKVRRFLKHLSDASQIVQQTGHLTSVITICNYDKYQSNDTTDETAGKTPNKTTDETQTRREEGKEGKKKSRGTTSVPNPGFSSDFMEVVWPYFAKHKKGPYKSIETQGVAIRQLFEMSSGEEAAARQALRETLTNNYQGFTWYFDRKGGSNGNARTTADRKGVSPEDFARGIEKIRNMPGLQRINQ